MKTLSRTQGVDEGQKQALIFYRPFKRPHNVVNPRRRGIPETLSRELLQFVIHNLLFLSSFCFLFDFGCKVFTFVWSENKNYDF